MFPFRSALVPAILAQGQGGAPNTLFAVLALAILVIDVLVIVSVLRSHKAFLVKVVWILLILFAPVLGLIVYFLLGREK